MSRRIAFLLFEEFQLLDAAGPISAFEIAERYQPGSYELRVIARRRGAVTSSSGASMNAAGLPSPASVDTLVIAGGSGTRAAARGERVFRGLRSRGHRPDRRAYRHYALDPHAGLLASLPKGEAGGGPDFR